MIKVLKCWTIIIILSWEIWLKIFVMKSFLQYPVLDVATYTVYDNVQSRFKFSIHLTIFFWSGFASSWKKSNKTQNNQSFYPSNFAPKNKWDYNFLLFISTNLQKLCKCKMGSTGSFNSVHGFCKVVHISTICIKNHWFTKLWRISTLSSQYNKINAINRYSSLNSPYCFVPDFL